MIFLMYQICICQLEPPIMYSELVYCHNQQFMANFFCKFLGNHMSLPLIWNPSCTVSCMYYLLTCDCNFGRSTSLCRNEAHQSNGPRPTNEHLAAETHPRPLTGMDPYTQGFQECTLVKRNMIW